MREHSEIIVFEVHEGGRLVDPPFLVSGQIDCIVNAVIMPDTGCNAYSLIDSSYVKKHHLQCILLPEPRDISAYDDHPNKSIHAIVRFQLDIGGVTSEILAYEVHHLAGQDVIVGTPWL